MQKVGRGNSISIPFLGKVLLAMAVASVVIYFEIDILKVAFKAIAGPLLLAFYFFTNLNS